MPLPNNCSERLKLPCTLTHIFHLMIHLFTFTCLRRPSLSIRSSVNNTSYISPSPPFPPPFQTLPTNYCFQTTIVKVVVIDVSLRLLALNVTTPFIWCFRLCLLVLKCYPDSVFLFPGEPANEVALIFVRRLLE